MMKVVVFAATGRTGRRVVKRALDDGHQVTGIARTPAKLDLEHESLDLKRGDVLDYESFADLLQGQDAVISTIGKESYLSRVSLYSEGITNITRAMKDHGVSRLIAITSGGTHPGWDRNNALFYEVLIKRILLRGEYQDMRRMEAIIQDSDLEWTIVRPSGLNDDDGAGNYRTKIGYSFSESSTTTRDDLAEFIVEELENNQFLREGVAVVTV
ncbi:SDR family oxidoreductase (plasmid) [Haladaptatus sp. SPP-AMP-3]|uniref:NAD(P)-dependent oxidoreductase n=1 Tax=Haladaptatus sp. SPP-AMP-3 TaxID=3121295 RepID=UPI003C30913C